LLAPGEIRFGFVSTGFPMSLSNISLDTIHFNPEQAMNRILNLQRLSTETGNMVVQSNTSSTLICC
jgi:hypothetical protein